MSSTRDNGIMLFRVAGLADDSVVDGEGCRLTIFVQGCKKRCPGCQNPSAQPFDGGTVMDTNEIIEKIKNNPLLSGVTFSGGEPFCQPQPLTEIAKKVHGMGLDVWSYSGSTLEELAASNDPDVAALLDETDVLVDGEYVDELRDLTLMFRGSKNQRVIDMNKTRAAKSVVCKHY